MKMDLYQLVEKAWKNKYIYFWSTLFYLVIVVAPLFGYLLKIFQINAFSLKNKKIWLIFVFFLVVYCIVIFIIHSKRKYPKFSKEAYGILFAINVENEEQYSLINKKFVNPFQNHCKIELPKVKTDMLNSFACKRFINIIDDKEKIRGFAKKYNYSFIIYGNSYFGNEHEELECKIEIDGFLNYHGELTTGKQWILNFESSVLWFQIRNIIIQKNTETNDFALSAKQLELIFEYILALTFLLCQEYNKANKIFLQLKDKLNLFSNDIPVINDIKRVIDSRICWSYTLMAKCCLSEYYQKKSSDSLYNMKANLDLASKYKEYLYDAKVLFGFYYFLNDRNTRKAIAVLSECKEENDLIWKQNIAFLKLYEEASIPNFLNAYKIYSKLFHRGKLTLDNVEEVSTFIHMIIDEEPNKKTVEFYIIFNVSLYRR